MQSLRALFWSSVSTLPLAAAATAQLPDLNEIYIFHSGADDQEFFELIGNPGLPLDDLMVLTVDGDAGDAGTLDGAWDLSGHVIPPSGYFVIGDGAVAGVNLNFGGGNTIEDGCQTVYLFLAADPSAVLALVGTDVSAAGATTILPTLGVIADLVAVIDVGYPALDTIYDGAAALGPVNTSIPPGVYRGGDSPGSWCGASFLDFMDGPNLNQPRTPGAANGPCVPETLFYAGFEHTSLGVAGLWVSPGGSLVVSNLGSSGLDGVSIEMGENQEFSRATLAMPFAAMTSSTSCTATGIGQVGGVGGVVLSTFTTQALPGPTPAISFTPDFSPLGSPTSAVEFYLNGQLVYSAAGLSAAVYTMSASASCVAGCGPGPTFPDKPIIELELEQAQPITPPGGSPVMADRVVMVPENPTVAVEFMTRVELTGADARRFLVRDEAIGFFQHEVRALGDARLAPQAGRLVVSNIGSSGQDGVSYVAEGAHNGFEVRMDPVDLHQSVGQALVLNSIGVLGGIPDSQIGELTLQGVGGTIEAVTDFTGLAAPTTHVEVFAAGVFQGSVDLPSGLVGTLSGGPQGQPEIVGGGKLPLNGFVCLVIRTEPSAIFMPAGGGSPLEGDSFRFIAAGGQTAVDSLSVLEVRGVDLQPVMMDGPLSVANANGLRHATTGLADFGRNPAGQLTVSNIGSSGQDGLTIGLGELSEFVTVDMRPLASAMPFLGGASATASAVGSIAGTPDQVLATTTALVTPSGQTVNLSAEFAGLGAQTMSLDLVLNGQLVSTHSGLTAAICEIPFPPTCNTTCGRLPGQVGPTLAIELGAPLSVVVAGGPIVVADSLFIRPENPTLQAEFVSELQLALTCPACPPLAPLARVVEEAVGIFSSRNFAVGQAEFSPDGDFLIVSNIGSSGLDGFAISVADIDNGIFTDLGPVDLWEAGRSMSTSAVGTFAGQPDTFLGTSRMENVGGALVFEADLGPLGSTEVRVEIYDAGVLVSSTILPAAGQAGVVTPGPLGSPGISKCGKFGPVPDPCWGWVLDFRTQITPTGQPPVLGDEIRMLANDAAGAIDSLSRFVVTAGGVDHLVVLDEQVTPGEPWRNYCGPAVDNSSGGPASMDASGSASIAANDLTLHASGMPTNQFGYFLNSTTQGFLFPVPNSQGALCIGGQIGRYNAQVFNTGATGSGSLLIDNASTPTPAGMVAIQPFTTWNFTCWFRDIDSGPTSNFTDGLEVMFVR